MRRGHNDAEIIFNDDGELLGFNLGWDFTSEHEWGIDGIAKAFGMDTELRAKNIGIDRWRVQKSPNLRRWMDKKHDHLLFVDYDSRHGWDDSRPPNLSEFPSYENREGEKTYFVGAWSESSWGFRVPLSQSDLITEIQGALDAHDVVIFRGGRAAPFGNSGLMICILSRLIEMFEQQEGESLSEMWSGDDLDQLALLGAAERTGIEKRLKDAEKRWYALSPRWADEEKTSVQFFLNPQKQKKYNHGWYTVEELEQWANDEGPILKENK